MINKKDCVILVNGYDKGEDLWEGFFKCLSINWPDNPFDIVLNTESKNYSYKNLNIKTLNLFSKYARPTWAYRLKKTLKCIDSKYILFLLDDFWIDNKIDTNFIYSTINIMETNERISNISFRNVPYENIDDGKYEMFEKRGDHRYLFNCQAAIWKREKLIKYLRNHESAWDWEMYGSIRGQKFDDDFYCLKKGKDEPFIYHEGVIHRGIWVKEIVEHYSKKYDIKIDLLKRGYETLEQMHSVPQKSTLYEKIFKPHFFKRLYVVIKSCIHKFLSTI